VQEVGADLARESFAAGNVIIGSGTPVIIAGPCLAESLDLCLFTATRLREACEQRNVSFIFKASYDKANRSSGSSPRGAGLHAGLEILALVKSQLGVPVTTDVHEPSQAAAVAQVVDLIQIPAFLCRQTDLLVASAETGVPVNVKKGQFLAPWDAKNIVDKLKGANATGIMLTERGTTFGYNNLVVDFAGLPEMRNLGVPVCFDATHSVQKPGGLGTASGGARQSIPHLGRAAVAVGIDALFLEVHPDPDNAQSDREIQWRLDQFEELLDNLLPIWRLAAGLKSQKFPS
jgi:2-dehydro-3-deoxyphosphooctonate aldolase (KDO 8-P synthase)